MICGGVETELISELDRYRRPLRTVACIGCGVLRSDPLPSQRQLDQFYGEQHRKAYKGVFRPRLKHVVRNGRLAAQRLREISARMELRGKALDVGCGGEWVYLAGLAGLETSGVELDPRYAAFGRESYGVDIREGGVDRCAAGPESLDLVTMFHVLEHLRDPVAAMRRALGWLAPNGRLVVEVPNIAARRQHPAKRFHEAHLYNFTVDSLSAAGRRAGGRILDVRLDASERNITLDLTPASAPSPATTQSSQDVRRRIEQIRSDGARRYYSDFGAWARAVSRFARFAGEQAMAWRISEPRAILDRVACG